MPMLVVHVGRMRMFVSEPAMLVDVSMWLSRGVFGTVLMAVMLIMQV